MAAAGATPCQNKLMHGSLRGDLPSACPNPGPTRPIAQAHASPVHPSDATAPRPPPPRQTLLHHQPPRAPRHGGGHDWYWMMTTYWYWLLPRLARKNNLAPAASPLIFWDPTDFANQLGMDATALHEGSPRPSLTPYNLGHQDPN